jgi:hypothetical protein
MKESVGSSRTSRIANLKKLPLTERGLKSNALLPPVRATAKEVDMKTSVATISASIGLGIKSSSSVVTASTSKTVVAVKGTDKQIHVTRHTSHVTSAPSSKLSKRSGGVGVGIVFSHEGSGEGDEMLSVKQFVK